MSNKEAVTLINKMTHFELAKTWRFAESSDPFVQGEAGKRLQERLFYEFGGFTPEISKELGWEK